jgi:hypothetical protein
MLWGGVKGVTYAWCCGECHTETRCRHEDICVGAIFKCPGCGRTFGAPGRCKILPEPGYGKAYKWVEMVVVPEDFDPGEGWRLTNHPDGTQQVFQFEWKWPPHIFIERVVSPKSRRKRWCVVNREPAEKWARALYAPKLAGPFPDLDSAKSAYILIMAAGG